MTDKLKKQIREQVRAEIANQVNSPRGQTLGQLEEAMGTRGGNGKSYEGQEYIDLINNVLREIEQYRRKVFQGKPESQLDEYQQNEFHAVQTIQAALMKLQRQSRMMDIGTVDPMFSITQYMTQTVNTLRSGGHSSGAERVGDHAARFVKEILPLLIQRAM